MSNSKSSEMATNKEFTKRLASAINSAYSIHIQRNPTLFARGRSSILRKAIAQKTGIGESTLYYYFNPIWDDQGHLVHGPKSIEIVGKLASLFGFSTSQLIYVAENCTSHDMLYTTLAGFYERNLTLGAVKCDAAQIEVSDDLQQAS